MKSKLLCALLGLSILISNQVSSQNRREILKDRKEKIQENIGKVVEIRKLVQEFRRAVINGEEQKSQELLSAIKEKFAALPESLKDRIEEKHPGTIERIQNLSVDDVDKDVYDDYLQNTETKIQRESEDGNSSSIENVKTSSVSHKETVTKTGQGEWENSGITTTENGKTFTNEGTTTRDGNTITHEGTVKNEEGEVIITREGIIEKDGNTINRNATITNEKTGESRTVDASYTKEGNTISYDKTITTQSGKTVEAEGTITKEGNTITKDGTISTEKGTVNLDATLKKDGNTITGHSELSTQDGNIIRTKDGTSTKDGNTRTTEVVTDWKDKLQRERTTVTKNEGTGEISRQTEIKNSRKNSYDGDLDILGKGFRNKASNKKQKR